MRLGRAVSWFLVFALAPLPAPAEDAGPDLLLVNRSRWPVCAVHGIPASPDLLESFRPDPHENLLGTGPLPPGETAALRFRRGYFDGLLMRACGDGPGAQFHGLDWHQEVIFADVDPALDGLLVKNASKETLCYLLVDPGEGFVQGVSRDAFVGERLEPGEARRVVPRPDPGWVVFADCEPTTLLGTVLFEGTTAVTLSGTQIPNRNIRGFWVHNDGDRPVCSVRFHELIHQRGVVEDLEHLQGDVIAPGEAFLFWAFVPSQSELRLTACDSQTTVRADTQRDRWLTRVQVVGTRSILRLVDLGDSLTPYSGGSAFHHVAVLPAAGGVGFRILLRGYSEGESPTGLTRHVATHSTEGDTHEAVLAGGSYDLAVIHQAKGFPAHVLAADGVTVPGQRSLYLPDLHLGLLPVDSPGEGSSPPPLDLQRMVPNPKEDPRSDAWGFSQVGAALHLLGDREKAEKWQQAALDLQEELADRVGRIRTLERLGALRADAGDEAAAGHHFHAALALLREHLAGEPEPRPLLLRLERETAAAPSVETLRRAILALRYRTVPERLLLAARYLLDFDGDLDAAERRASSAALVAEAHGDTALGAEALTLLGRVAEVRGRHAEALELLRRGAETPAAGPGFEARLAAARRGLRLAEAMLRQGRPRTAGRWLRSSSRELEALRDEHMPRDGESVLHLVDQVELVTEERRARIAAAAVLASQGEDERALELLRAELTAAISTDTPIPASTEGISPQLELQGELSVRVARQSRLLGLIPESLQEARRARRLAREIGDVRLLAESLLEEGRSLLELHEPARADEVLRQAVDLASKVGDPDLRARALLARHLAARALDREDPPGGLALKALEVARNGGSVPVLVTVLAAVGRDLLDRGEPERALEYLREARKLQGALETDRGKAELLLTLGTTQLRLGRTASGLTQYREAFRRFELRRDQLDSEQLRSAYGARLASFYEEAVTASWDAGRHHDAFRMMERARARTLDARLAGPDPDSSPEDLLGIHDWNLRQSVEKMRRHVEEMRSGRRDSSNDRRLAEVLDRLEAVLGERERLLRRASELRAVPASGGAAAPTLQDIQATLEEGSRLVELFTTRDRTLALVIGPDLVRPFTLAATEAELAGQLEWLLAAIASRGRVETPAQRLYDRLLRPLEPALDAPLWIVVPHRGLHSVPFAALHDGSGWLGDRVAVAVLPRAGVLLRSTWRHHRDGLGRIVVAGDPAVDGLPQLELARREAQGVAALAGVRPLLREAATEDAIRALAPRTKLLHLAVHGEPAPANPLFSALRLGTGDKHDGRLEVHEIHRLGFSSGLDLAVLSACSTRQGPRDAGEEILSLSRAFLAAGARTVVSSLWNIEDESTAVLMELFYRHLGEGLPKAEALRRAQAALRAAGGSHAHPYFWAGFLLTGDAGPLEVPLRGARPRDR